MANTKQRNNEQEIGPNQIDHILAKHISGLVQKEVALKRTGGGGEVEVEVGQHYQIISGRKSWGIEHTSIENFLRCGMFLWVLYDGRFNMVKGW